MQHIAVLDLIGLAFYAELAGFLGPCLAPASDVVIVSHGFGTDKTLLPSCGSCQKNFTCDRLCALYVSIPPGIEGLLYKYAASDVISARAPFWSSASAVVWIETPIAEIAGNPNDAPDPARL